MPYFSDKCTRRAKENKFDFLKVCSTGKREITLAVISLLLLSRKAQAKVENGLSRRLHNQANPVRAMTRVNFVTLQAADYICFCYRAGDV